MSIKGSYGTLTLKYSNIPQLKKDVETILNRAMDSQAHRFKTAATKAMLQIGRQAVLDWYAASGLRTGEEVASALRTESIFVRNQGGHKLIRLTSYFDSSVLDATSSYFDSAERWCYRHEDIDCEYTPGTYVFLLRWNTGALNLPEESNVSDWINDNYQVSPYGALQNYFAMSIMANMERTIPLLIRERNQAMGVGINSKNRGGMANLRH